MDKLFKGEIERLRSPERIARLEVERVVELSLEKLFVTKVLDVGCGSGLFSEAFALRNLHATGIDSNPAMIGTASKLVPDASFKCAAAEKLPFADKSFDLVFLAHVLHESPSPLTVLQEAHRVAKYRIAILEWPYRAEDSGPPLDHRMKPDIIRRTAHKAACIRCEKIDLVQMVFYRMTPT